MYTNFKGVPVKVEFKKLMKDLGINITETKCIDEFDGIISLPADFQIETMDYMETKE